MDVNFFPVVSVTINATVTSFLQVKSKQQTSLPFADHWKVLAIDLKTREQLYMYNELDIEASFSSALGNKCGSSVC